MLHNLWIMEWRCDLWSYINYDFFLLKCCQRCIFKTNTTNFITHYLIRHARHLPKRLFPRYYWQTKGQASHVRARSFVGRSKRTLRRSVARCHTHGRNVYKITKINPLFSIYKTHVRSLFIDGIPHAAITINVNLCSVTLKLKIQYLTNKRYSQPNRGSTHINRARKFSNNEANCNSFSFVRWSALWPSVEMAFSSCTFELQTMWRWLKPRMCQQSPSVTAAIHFPPHFVQHMHPVRFLALFVSHTSSDLAVVLVLLCPHDSVSWWWWWWLSEWGLAALRWRWSCLLYISALPIRAVYVHLCVCVCVCAIVWSWPHPGPSSTHHGKESLHGFCGFGFRAAQESPDNTHYPDRATAVGSSSKRTKLSQSAPMSAPRNRDKQDNESFAARARCEIVLGGGGVVRSHRDTPHTHPRRSNR